MLSWLAPDARALLGAAVGAGMALLGAFLSEPDSIGVPYTVLLVLAIGIIGLALGAGAAAWAWAAGVMVVAVVLLQRLGDVTIDTSDLVRLGAFVIGSPFLVYLVQRAEQARTEAGQALEASHAAQELAAAERQRLEEARRDVDEALAGAERERARLEEVAEAIPEPLVVYDDRLRGTYGNRAALRLFGRAFVERPLDEWGRSTEPRDERGQPLERE